MGAPNTQVLVGVIVGAHGIKGEVKLKSLTADPLSITRYGPLQSAAGQLFEFAKIRPAKDDFIAVLKNVTDRNQAELLKGAELFVNRDRLPKLASNEAYAHDMIGQEVVLMDGAKLGRLIAMPNYGAGDLLEVEREAGAETILIPFTTTFVPQSDFTSGKITVVLPEGYLDEDDDK